MEPPYTPAELAEVHAYHAPIYAAAVVELVVMPLVLAVLATFGVKWLYRLAPSGVERPSVLARVWGDGSWKKALSFSLLYFLLLALLDLPKSIWFGYVREKEFGLATGSFGTFVIDSLKAHAMLFLAVAALTFGLFGIARRTKHWWWLVGLAASLVMVVSTALDPYRARLYVDQTPLEAGTLRDGISELLKRAEVPFSDVLVVQTGSRTVRVQAAFAGTGPTRTILLTDTLLTSMTEKEVLAAIAHESGHVHESRWVGRVLSPLAIFALLGALEFIFRRSVKRRWYGVTQRGDVRVLPTLVLIFQLALMAIGPVTSAFARERESAADLYALQLTGDAESLTSLLRKLGKINKVDPAPPRWYVLSGVTHPTIAERIAAIQKNATPPPITPVNVGTSVQQAPGVMR